MQNLKKSIVDVGYAPITGVADDGTYTYDNIVWLIATEAGGREYSAEPKGEATEIYANGIVVYSAEENNGYDIKLTLLAAIDDVEKDWIGNDVIAGGGIIEKAKSAERPKFALIVVEDTTAETGLTTVFFNCSVSTRPSISGKTSEGKFDPQFPEYAISARPRPEDKLVRVTLPQKERIKTVPAITSENETAHVISLQKNESEE